MEKGPKCILTRCIEPKCKKTVETKYWLMLLSGKYKKKYNEYLLHSFVFGRMELNWCPGPNCQNAIKCDIGSSEIGINIECHCGYVYCSKCRLMIHEPCNCILAEKWLVLHKSDAENVTWARANGKECKKCKNYIQKNQGCNHMTCRCGYEFCWLCRKEWKSVGGYGHKCNKPQDVVNEENEQERMKTYLKRFTHYFERYDSHDKSAKFTENNSLKNAIKCRNYFVGKKNTQYKMKDLEYILESCNEIIIARKVLQWSYAYGYYLKDKTNIKNLFETQQGLLESFADELHSKAEKIIDDEKKWNELLSIKYREKLITLTKTVKKYRTNFSSSLKNSKFIYQPGLDSTKKF